MLNSLRPLKSGAEGFCYQGDDDRDFIIEIDHRLSRVKTKEEFIECVIHEMVHVWQGATGRIKDKFRGGYKKLWKCKDGKYRNYLNTAYHETALGSTGLQDAGSVDRSLYNEN